MPKLKLAKRSQALDSLTANIRWHLDKCDLSYSEAAVIVGVSQATFYNRMRKPEDFLLKELVPLADRFGVSLQTLLFGSVQAVAV